MSKNQFSVILLAGGIGSRMKSSTPKQFLLLKNKPIAQYSLDVFLAMPETAEIIVVCEPNLRQHFSRNDKLKWALPGPRRQDTAYNGLQKVSTDASYVCIHDACRPFIDTELVRRVFSASRACGAAAAAMPLRFTIKEADHSGTVVDTPDRTFFWEIQTPQMLEKRLLVEGFAKAHANKLTVTDDTSLAELLGAPVKLTEGSYSNIKITTPEDYIMAKMLVNSHE